MHFCKEQNIWTQKILIWSPERTFLRSWVSFCTAQHLKHAAAVHVAQCLMGPSHYLNVTGSLHCRNVFPTKSWTHTYLITVILFGFKVHGDYIIVVICQQTCAVVLLKSYAWSMMCSTHLHPVVCSNLTCVRLFPHNTNAFLWCWLSKHT